MADEGGRRVGNVINDLQIWTNVYPMVKYQRMSLGSAASSLNPPLTGPGLLECLKRLREEFGQPVVETFPRSTKIQITETGEYLYKNANIILSNYEHIKAFLKNQNKKSELPGNQVVRVIASPHLLAHLLPNAKSDYLSARTNGTHLDIECREGYLTEDVINELLLEHADFAVLWDYAEKTEKIAATNGLACVASGHGIPAVIVFGRDHVKFMSRLRDGERCVYLDELASEILYVMEPQHQPLEKLIPPIIAGGSRIVVTTFQSIIGGLRAGMPGSGIAPGFFSDLDRYRRDGSLYFLPLKSRGGTDDKLEIKIIYAFRSATPRMRVMNPLGTVEKSTFDDARFRNLSKPAALFLEHIEKKVMPNAIKESGWFAEESLGGVKSGVNEALFESFHNIDSFVHIYHVSPHKIGFDRPKWHESTVSWVSLTGNKKRQASEVKSIRIGNMVTVKSGKSTRKYRLEAEMVGKQVITVKGLCLTEDGQVDDRDCFAANFNFVFGEAGLRNLLGSVAAHDDSGTSPMLCSIVMSQEPFDDQGHLRNYLQSARARTIFRNDIDIINSKT